MSQNLKLNLNKNLVGIGNQKDIFYFANLY